MKHFIFLFIIFSCSGLSAQADGVYRLSGSRDRSTVVTISDSALVWIVEEENNAIILSYAPEEPLASTHRIKVNASGVDVRMYFSYHMEVDGADIIFYKEDADYIKKASSIDISRYFPDKDYNPFTSYIKMILRLSNGDKINFIGYGSTSFNANGTESHGYIMERQ